MGLNKNNIEFTAYVIAYIHFHILSDLFWAITLLNNSQHIISGNLATKLGRNRTILVLLPLLNFT